VLITVIGDVVSFLLLLPLLFVSVSIVLPVLVRFE
jgi:hypothetical protein